MVLVFVGKVRFSHYPPTLIGGYGIHRGGKKLENLENLILVDWLTFTSKIWSEHDLISLLGLDGCTFELVERGRYGYRRRLHFSGISILSDGTEDMGICVEISGSGCRTFETYSSVSWLSLFNFLMYELHEINITRLDLAYDDHSGILDIAQLLDDTDAGLYRSKSRWWMVEYGSTGSTIYHGSPQSNTRIRIYDKAAERGILDGSHWIRVELQLRSNNAINAVASILSYESIGQVFCGVLRNYLSYLVESNDSNKSRWPLAQYWSDLIGSIDSISVFSSPGIEYNVFRLQSYLSTQVVGAAYTWIQVQGLDSLVEMFKHRPKHLNPKHRKLLQDFGKG